jgi:hypothetical protein
MKKQLLILTTALLSLSGFAQVPNYVPTNGLVAYYPFNGNANDESGNGNNGTVNGLVSLSSDRNGIINSSYSWPNSLSSSNYINLNNLTQFIPNSISISCWIYLDGSTTNSRIISTGEMGLIINQDIGNDVYLKCSYNQAGSQIWPSTFLVSKYVWHHIVFTSNYATNIADFYIDGVHTDTNSGGIATNSSINDWNIGRKSISSFDGYGGEIDDIGIWNRALTACEIKNLYNAGVPNSSQNQIALDSYTWPQNNQTYTQSGVYTDTILNAAGCDSLITLNLSLDFTGLQELENSFTISPNPAKDQLNVLSPSGISENYFLLDGQGRKVLAGKLIGTTTTIDISKLAAGNYLMQVGEEQMPVRIVKN